MAYLKQVWRHIIYIWRAEQRATPIQMRQSKELICHKRTAKSLPQMQFEDGSLLVLCHYDSMSQILRVVISHIYHISYTSIIFDIGWFSCSTSPGRVTCSRIRIGVVGFSIGQRQVATAGNPRSLDGNKTCCSGVRYTYGWNTTMQHFNREDDEKPW